MDAAVHYYDMVKVWPLREGLDGLTPRGAATRLMPGVPGWMHRDRVGAAVRNGDVQTMVGLRPKDLKAMRPGEPVDPPQPTSDPAPSNREIKRRKRRQYARRDLTAEQEPVPFIHGAPPVPPPTPKA